jgi:hypothetical protein
MSFPYNSKVLKPGRSSHRWKHTLNPELKEMWSERVDGNILVQDKW